MLFIWSEAALAALMADESFLAAITAAPEKITIFRKIGETEKKNHEIEILFFFRETAPRFWTVGKKVVLNQSASLITSAAIFPLIVAWAASGNCVDEWLPQMMTFFTLATSVPALLASWAKK